MARSDPSPPARPPVQLLFDGVCGLCDRSVAFIMRHDRRRQFTFSPLQSPAGRAAVRRIGLTENYFDSIVLIDGDAVYTHSAAVLNIARRLGWPWKLAYPLIVLPRFLRDAAYLFLARHRYQWFGKRDACRIPTPGERAQFIVDVDEPAAALPQAPLA